VSPPQDVEVENMIKFVGCVTSMQIVVSVDFYMANFYEVKKLEECLRNKKYNVLGKKAAH